MIMAEHIEDAIAAYLRERVGGDVLVAPAWDGGAAVRYPCVLVHAGRERPVSEGAEYHEPRMVDVEVVCLTEAVPEADATGGMVLTPRERNMAVRADVLAALRRPGVAGDVTARSEHGVVLSSLHVLSVVRDVADNHTLQTRITVEVCVG